MKIVCESMLCVCVCVCVCVVCSVTDAAVIVQQINGCGRLTRARKT